ncbi:hypothetical protein MRX96_027100 [Rhipicephalus microplus]
MRPRVYLLAGATFGRWASSSVYGRYSHTPSSGRAMFANEEARISMDARSRDTPGRKRPSDIGATAIVLIFFFSSKQVHSPHNHTRARPRRARKRNFSPRGALFWARVYVSAGAFARVTTISGCEAFPPLVRDAWSRVLMCGRPLTAVP